jgi:hypothetical protein
MLFVSKELKSNICAKELILVDCLKGPKDFVTIDTARVRIVNNRITKLKIWIIEDKQLGIIFEMMSKVFIPIGWQSRYFG